MHHVGLILLRVYYWESHAGAEKHKQSFWERPPQESKVHQEDHVRLPRFVNHYGQDYQKNALNTAENGERLPFSELKHKVEQGDSR